MTLLVLSDSHGASHHIREVLERQDAVGAPDYLLFLGDGVRDIDESLLPSKTCVLSVKGNHEFYDGSLPMERVLSLCEYKALMLHGHSCGVKLGLTAAIAKAVSAGADLLLYGHTHTPHEQVMPAGTVLGGKKLEKPLYIFNPGSLCAGSFGVITIGKQGILMSHGSLW